MRILAILVMEAGIVSAASWKQINSGLPVTIAGVRALTFDPATPSIIYATTASGSVFKTVDSGGSWTPISTVTHVQSVVADPVNSSTLYATTSHGILKSSDAGETWTSRSVGLPSGWISELVIARTNPAVLYALTRGGLFKSTDGAQNWNALDAKFYAFTDAKTPLASGSFFGVVVDPKNSSILYGKIYGSVPGLFKSTDGGKSWYAVNIPFVSANAGAVPVFHPAIPSTIYVWYPDSNFPNSAGHLLESTDDGSTWQDIGNGGIPSGSYLENLAFDPASPLTLYASYGGGNGWGLVKSTDGGKNWRPLDTGLPPYRTGAVVGVSPASTVFAGYVDLSIGRGRLVKSKDGGASWSAADNNLTYVDVRALAIDPANAATAYAGMGGAGEGVFKSTDGGGNWTNLGQFQINGTSAFLTNPPFPGEPGTVGALAIDSANPNVLYAATARVSRSCIYTDKLFFKSADGGTNWSDIANPPQNGCAFFFAPAVLALRSSDPDDLYIGGGGDCGGSFLDESVDGGRDWRVLSYDFGSTLNALAIDPTNRAILFAATPEGVFKSIDGGAHWTNVGLSMGAVALAIDPADPNVLYGAVSQVLYKSIDGGASWSTIDKGLERIPDAGAIVTSVVIAPQTPHAIYVATSGSGVYKSTDGGSHWTPFNKDLTNLDVRVLAVAPSGPSELYAATPSGVFKIADERVEVLRLRK